MRSDAKNTGALCPTVHNRRRSSVEISSNQIAPFLGVEASLPVESTKSQNITGDVSRGAYGNDQFSAASPHCSLAISFSPAARRGRPHITPRRFHCFCQPGHLVHILVKM
jgi:hypothetical protein